MIFVNRHYRRNETFSFGRRNHHRFTALHHRGDGIGSTKINANDFCHEMISPYKDKGTMTLRLRSTQRGGALWKIYRATLTSAGRITRSPIIYPFWTTPITCPLWTPSAGSCEIASWKFGSNSVPIAS